MREDHEQNTKNRHCYRCVQGGDIVKESSKETIETPIILADSITHVEDESALPIVVICGSHGGWASGVFTLQKKIKGVIFNDAGGGKDQAGMAALPLLDTYRIVAATVDAFSARIGVAEETAHGIISHVNGAAREAGVRPGMTAREAAEIMRAVPSDISSRSSALKEQYHEQLTVIHTSPSGYRIVAMDSNSMVTPENKKDIIMTGSHGGLVGSVPAVKYPVIAAFYNDAGVGKEQAGVSRLAWLQKAGVISATVDAATARIGVGMETYLHGIISHAGVAAQEIGITRGTRAFDAAWRILKLKEAESARAR